MYQQGDLFEAAPPPVPMVEFPSSARINKVKFKSDNGTVYAALLDGRVINRTDPDMLKLTLHSRISDLRNKYKIPGIMDDNMRIEVEGRKITVSKYWMTYQEIEIQKPIWEEAINKLRNQFQ